MRPILASGRRAMALILAITAEQNGHPGVGWGNDRTGMIKEWRGYRVR